MHFKHRRVEGDRARRTVVPPRNNGPALRPTRPPLALAGSQRDRERLRSIEAALADAREPGAASELVVGWGRRPKALVIWLSGTLDRGTRTVLDTELDARALGAMSLVVDLTGLEFIDASGLDTLARIHSRATERGDRLSFRHGQHLAQRPLGLIRAAQLRSDTASRRARPGNQDSYLALALACADVGHPGLGDRPRAA